MGITAQEFEANVTQEINEIIQQANTERLLERIFPTLPNTSGADPPSRILTKEDCLSLFRATGEPSSGSLLGVYRWAADLGHAKFNFEKELEDHEFHFLDEYDLFF
jgi:hypothetical protein